MSAHDNLSSQQFSDWAHSNPEGVQSLNVQPQALREHMAHLPYAKRPALDADVAEHGVRAPIPVRMRPHYADDGSISHYSPRMVDGHHRLDAAIRANHESVPVTLYGPQAYKASDEHADRDTHDGIAHWR